MVSELGGSQISTLLETLPGIANVLRSPVADALGSVIRAGARLSEFNVQDAEELVRYATRRGLLGQEPVTLLLTEQAAAGGIAHQLLRVLDAEFGQAGTGPNHVAERIGHGAPKHVGDTGKCFQQGRDL